MHPANASFTMLLALQEGGRPNMRYIEGGGLWQLRLS
jgi:hypothetical protein